MFKVVKGYRTLIVNAITAILGLLAAVGIINAPITEGGVDVSTAVDNLFGVILMMVSAVNTLLRFYTTTEVGKNQ